MKEIVVLVPGTESSSEKVFAGLRPLLARDYEVVDFNFSSEAKNSSEENFFSYAEQLNDLLQQFADRKIHLFGYSLGAHIVMAVAAHKKEISSLCLLAGWLKTDSMQKERHDLWLDLYETEPKLAGRLSALLQYSPTYRYFLSQQQIQVSLESPIPDEETKLRVLVNRTIDSTQNAKSIEQETLIIAGKNDYKVSKENTFELHGAIDNSHLVFSNSGHGALRERVGEIYSIYKDFLMKQSSDIRFEYEKTLTP